jgi:HK97 family phage portal protein
VTSFLRKVRNAQGAPPVNVGNTGSLLRGHSFTLGNGRQDRETSMRQYGMSGTVFSIVSLLAEASATPTWRLYRKQPVDGRRRYTTGDQGSDQRTEVIQHPAIQLWNQPNTMHSGFEFREGSQQHEELTGETFWVLDTEIGFPTGIWYVRPDRMEPVPAPDGTLTGWIYTGPNGEQVPLKASEVILEKRPDPLDPYRGAGPVAAIMPNIQQQRYATEYQRNLFLNGADPGGVITVPNKLNDRDFDQLVDRWRESHRGVARAGHVGVLEDGAEWNPSAHTNKDMEYGELRLANRDELREAWRIHKTMLGTADDVNRANAQTAQEVFVAWQILPRLNRRRDTLNSKLLPLFGSTGANVEFDYDDPSPVNAETAVTELAGKAAAAASLVAAGFDPGDVLEVVGLPDMGVVEKATQSPSLPPGWVAVPPAEPGAPAAPAGPGEDMAALLRKVLSNGYIPVEVSGR